MFKSLSAILIPYFFILSIMPCGDQLVEWFEKQDHEVHHKMTSLLNHDHNHENHADLCSPFCMCNCCSTPITLTFFTPVFEYHKDIFKNEFYYSKSHPKGFSKEIFQPPKA